MIFTGMDAHAAGKVCGHHNLSCKPIGHMTLRPYLHLLNAFAEASFAPDLLNASGAQGRQAVMGMHMYMHSPAHLHTHPTHTITTPAKMPKGKGQNGSRCLACAIYTPQQYHGSACYNSDNGADDVTGQHQSQSNRLQALQACRGRQPPVHSLMQRPAGFAQVPFCWQSAVGAGEPMKPVRQAPGHCWPARMVLQVKELLVIVPAGWPEQYTAGTYGKRVQGSRHVGLGYTSGAMLALTQHMELEQERYELQGMACERLVREA